VADDRHVRGRLANGDKKPRAPGSKAATAKVTRDTARGTRGRVERDARHIASATIFDAAVPIIRALAAAHVQAS